MPLKAPITTPTSDREFAAWCRDTGDTRLITGTGDPEGVYVANRGVVFLRTDGGASTTLYVKTSGDGTSSGWTAK
jgi:hypothetical protein